MCHLDRLLPKDAPSWLAVMKQSPMERVIPPKDVPSWIAVMKHTNTNGVGDPTDASVAVMTTCSERYGMSVMLWTAFSGGGGHL